MIKIAIPVFIDGKFRTYFSYFSVGDEGPSIEEMQDWILKDARVAEIVKDNKVKSIKIVPGKSASIIL